MSDQGKLEICQWHKKKSACYWRTIGSTETKSSYSIMISSKIKKAEPVDCQLQGFKTRYWVGELRYQGTTEGFMQSSIHPAVYLSAHLSYYPYGHRFFYLPNLPTHLLIDAFMYPSNLNFPTHLLIRPSIMNFPNHPTVRQPTYRSIYHNPKQVLFVLSPLLSASIHISIQPSTR